MTDVNIDVIKQEHEAYKKLYDSLTDFGQKPILPIEKLDYVKARVFDTTVLLNRITRQNSPL